MRFGQRGGRFDQRHETDNIFEATELDLQGYEGQTLLWYVFDVAGSESDPIYSVGSVGTGRRWKNPFELPVITVVRTEGSEDANENGFYVTDTVHVSISMRQAENAGLTDLVTNPTRHDLDRFVWQGDVFSPVRIQPRGLLQNRHTVVGVDAVEVNPEELVNDDQFSSYVPPVDPSPPTGDPDTYPSYYQYQSQTTPPQPGTDPLYG